MSEGGLESQFQKQFLSSQYSYSLLQYPPPTLSKLPEYVHIYEGNLIGKKVWQVSTKERSYFLIENRKYYGYRIPTPTFTNLRWVKETVNSPTNDLTNIMFLFTLRNKEETAILVGDWKGQSFDISCLAYDEVRKIRKLVNNSEIGYNSDVVAPIAKGILAFSSHTAKYQKH